MFKKLGDLLYRTPWWGLLLGGFFAMAALVMFTIPIHLLRLSDSGKTPQERSAIKREINIAFGDRALDVAESVVGSMKARTSDPDRKRELDLALAEMARARAELSRAQTSIAGATRESARNATDAALASATAAAESALESATDAREAIQDAREEAIGKLEGKGIDASKTIRSLDELLKSARESEANARESLAALEALAKNPQAVVPARPATGKGDASSGPASPAGPDSARPGAAAPGATGPDATGPGGTGPGAPGTAAGVVPPGAATPSAGPAIVIDTQPKGAAAKGRPGIQIQFDTDLLAPDVRNDIHAKVAGDVWRIGVGSALILIFIPLFILLVFAKYFIGRSRRALAFAEEKKQEARISDVSRQITEARLQALQAQVEPHFLYNTLANVQALTETDPPAANAMVGHLIQYLRAALPKMRENTSTIGQEVELVTAYLNVLRMRMGPRLEFGIDVPPDLVDRPFPPLMLPSLVENAIKHGLEPVREGGRIEVVVARVPGPGGERIRVQVRDNGRGFSDAPKAAGSGIGLSNLRERLAALYGDRATFVIESNDPRGVIATIEIPSAPATAGIAAGAAAATNANRGSNGNGGTASAARADAGSSASAAAFASRASATSPGGGASAPDTRWRRVWRMTSRTHSVWAWIVSRVFLGLMALLAIGFLLALIGLYAGWLPVDVGDIHLGGVESMALGSLILLAAFALAAIAVAIVAAVFYGLGFFFAALIVIVPAIILIALFPVLAPFILVGLAVYWFWWRKRRRVAGTDQSPAEPSAQTAQTAQTQAASSSPSSAAPTPRAGPAP